MMIRYCLFIIYFCVWFCVWYVWNEM